MKKKFLSVLFSSVVLCSYAMEEEISSSEMLHKVVAARKDHSDPFSATCILRYNNNQEYVSKGSVLNLDDNDLNDIAKGLFVFFPKFDYQLTHFSKEAPLGLYSWLSEEKQKKYEGAFEKDVVGVIIVGSNDKDLHSKVVNSNHTIALLDALDSACLSLLVPATKQ